MAFSLPPLPAAGALIDKDGKPTLLFQTYWQQVTQAIASALNFLADLEGTTIPDFKQAIKDAQTAAMNANMAATNANQTSKLVNSYINPSSVLTATRTAITIADHTRYYADGTSVAVKGGTVGVTGAGDTDYVSYDDPTFVGGTVKYVVQTYNPAQIDGTHVVGAINIPQAGTASGGSGPRQPGTVQP